MSPLLLALVATGGSMLGATLAQLVAWRLRNKRENAVKFGEALQKLQELRFESHHADEAAFNDKRNAFTLWMIGARPYLSLRQRQDIHVLALALDPPVPGALPPTPKQNKRWKEAESRLFPSLGLSVALGLREKPRLAKRLKAWFADRRRGAG